MSSLKQFRLPDVGEGLTEAEIVSWKVKAGDTVAVNEVVVEIETAKSLVELPSPFAGVVAELLVAEGATVDVGTPIITVETDLAAAAAPPPASPGPVAATTTREHALPDLTATVAAGVPVPPEDAAVEPGLIGGPAPGGRTSVLVGYGPRVTEAKRRPRKVAALPDGGSAAAPGGVAPAAGAPTAAPSPVASVSVLAKPPVRKLAKDLGVDLAAVAASGPGGTVTRADVEAAAGGADAASPARAVAVPSGGQTRVAVKGVRKVTAQAMVASAFTAPHVTEWLTVDATRTVELVERLKRHRDFRDVRVSPLLVLAKAMILAIRRTPEVNASWEDGPDGATIVLEHSVNLGIAAATPRGLVVPNVKGAETLGLRELAEAINALAATAREGRTQPADMAGGTITITNVGVFGVDSGTPILNPGEAAIVAFGAIRDLPWVVDGAVVARKVCTLAVSFDHRIVDGEQGSRFLADVGAILEDPATALLF